MYYYVRDAAVVVGEETGWGDRGGGGGWGGEIIIINLRAGTRWRAKRTRRRPRKPGSCSSRSPAANNRINERDKDLISP